MKLSVSMDDQAVDFIDQYAAEHEVGSRSAVLQKAVALLRAVELSDDYTAAWGEWSESDDSALWDAAAGDGLSPPSG